MIVAAPSAVSDPAGMANSVILADTDLHQSEAAVPGCSTAMPERGATPA